MNRPDVALISQVPHLINRFGLEQFAKALQTQVDRDLQPAWGRSATVRAYDRDSDAPPGSWRIIICDSQHDAGFHKAQDNLPYAKVFTDTDTAEVCKTCSHELLEMLIDPDGDWKLRRPRIRGIPGGPVDYLVEICDPCQQQEYTIDDQIVADFVFPAFFDDPNPVPNTWYSMTGAVTGPRTVLPGGYMTWQVPENKVWQIMPFLNSLDGPFDLPGAPNAQMTVRRWVDRHSQRTLRDLIHELSDSERECFLRYRAQCRCQRELDADE